MRTWREIEGNRLGYQGRYESKACCNTVQMKVWDIKSCATGKGCHRVVGGRFLKERQHKKKALLNPFKLYAYCTLKLLPTLYKNALNCSVKLNQTNNNIKQ